MTGTSKHITVIGAGHAGGSAAALLRQYGCKDPITLIGAEPLPPYQRPPLSKAWLKTGGDQASLLLRPASFYATNDVSLVLSASVSAIDRIGHQVTLSSGDRLPYDRLILATGARPRTLPIPGTQLVGVHELRSVADADRLRAALRAGTRLAVIGAGYIGLEVAASARALGADVVVIEREARVLPRVASLPLSAFFHRHHAAEGVRVVLDSAVQAIDDADGGVTGVRLHDGRTLACDAVLVGIGAVPNDALAAAAGLTCADGVLVDSDARTSDPEIFAIGDCTRRPLPRYARTGRLESVPNALEQAKQAAAALCGRPPPAPEVPWFWSDQYDVRLQIAGLPFDAVQTVLRGDPATGAFTVFHLAEDGIVQCVEAVNAPADFMAGKLMIAQRRRAVAARLQDMSCSLRDLAA